MRHRVDFGLFVIPKKTTEAEHIMKAKGRGEPHDLRGWFACPWGWPNLVGLVNRWLLFTLQRPG